MSEYEDCPFCEMGQWKRMLIYRMMGEMSRKELVALRDEFKFRKLIRRRT